MKTSSHEITSYESMVDDINRAIAEFKCAFSAIPEALIVGPGLADYLDPDGAKAIGGSSAGRITRSYPVYNSEYGELEVFPDGQLGEMAFELVLGSTHWVHRVVPEITQRGLKGLALGLDELTNEECVALGNTLIRIGQGLEQRKGDDVVLTPFLAELFKIK